VHKLQRMRHSKKGNDLHRIQYLIVDEVSMVSDIMLKTMDYVLRQVKDNQHIPFGGVVMIFVGDFLQLPPIYNKDVCFDQEFLSGVRSTRTFRDVAASESIASATATQITRQSGGNQAEIARLSETQAMNALSSLSYGGDSASRSRPKVPVHERKPLKLHDTINWNAAAVVPIVLNHTFRFSDARWGNMLNRLRKGKDNLTEEDIALLESRVNRSDTVARDVVSIYFYRSEVDRVNNTNILKRFSISKRMLVSAATWSLEVNMAGIVSIPISELNNNNLRKLYSLLFKTTLSDNRKLVNVDKPHDTKYEVLGEETESDAYDLLKNKPWRTHLCDALQRELLSHDPNGYKQMTKIQIPIAFYELLHDRINAVITSTQHNQIVRISPGSKLMFNHNISIDDGIVNGTTGMATILTPGTHMGELKDRRPSTYCLCSEDKTVQYPIEPITKSLTKLSEATPTLRRGDKAKKKTIMVAVRSELSSREPDWNFIFSELCQYVKCSLHMTMTQLPVDPAWAITSHKSQGRTFANITANINRSFSTGQEYVVLSRCPTSDGVYLYKWSPSRIQTDMEEVDWYNSIESAIEDHAPRIIDEFGVPILHQGIVPKDDQLYYALEVAKYGVGHTQSTPVGTIPVDIPIDWDNDAPTIEHTLILDNDLGESRALCDDDEEDPMPAAGTRRSREEQSQ